TEAEWEYASRYKDGINLTPGDYASGATNDYNNAAACSNVAWWSVNSGSDTHPVGSKAANALGLCDMSGNVWEWCWDWYDAAYYDGGTMTDPTGSATGLTRMSRGGCWFHSGEYLRCSPSG
ncbi:MAG: SUMF1/EgtB/PvdO family nonheme iron enzyme, partial [Spirochaetes bacterium]|nr:SUMF1/EgtB/PvdO family nonheme iron enzyme [Spirochaetota bacterium]